jgi:hypothetical protein
MAGSSASQSNRFCPGGTTQSCVPCSMKKGGSSGVTSVNGQPEPGVGDFLIKFLTGRDGQNITKEFLINLPMGECQEVLSTISTSRKVACTLSSAAVLCRRVVEGCEPGWKTPRIRALRLRRDPLRPLGTTGRFATRRGAVARTGDSLNTPPFFFTLDLVLCPSRAGEAWRWAADEHINRGYEP